MTAFGVVVVIDTVDPAIAITSTALTNDATPVVSGTAEAAVITGSFNFTQAAQHRNAENLLILRGNPALVKIYLENWQQHRAEARLLRSLDELPGRKRKESGRESDRATPD